MMRLATISLIGVLLFACGGDGALDGQYVALGDSISAGNGASDPAQTGVVALVAADRDVPARNLAVAGATASDLVERQLPAAMELVEAGDVAFVTVSAGGNDLAALIPNAACVEEPLPAACPLDETLFGIEERLLRIIDDIRDFDGDVPIVLIAYPNFFSGTGHAFEAPAERVLRRFAEMLRDVSSTQRNVAVAEPSFEGRGGELTHVLDEPSDPHPNDAGQQVIAEAVLVALREID